ncbi:MAG TPA: hypothetical protein VD969_16740 [Symbiobacteriaceae bacterium]|nr:hypothetical protein [Symbiobacteriaceae bacterium]
MRAIGIAGTAKNTGKTTSLNAILLAAADRGLRTAITSIGYDGEEFDHLTGLPKPRVTVTEGMLVATAVGTLRGATAGVERVGRTGVLTTLGEVVVVRVLQPGLIPLAGPPTGAGVTVVVQALAEFGADLILVDGAFGRMAPFAVLDGVILATGGARSRDISRLAEETVALAWMFSLPTLRPESAVVVENLLSESSAQRALQQLERCAQLRVAGAVSRPALDVLANWKGWETGAACIFSDPIQLALAGDPVSVRGALQCLSKQAELGVLKPVQLKAVTINPFYPDAGAGAKGQFRPGFLDAEALYGAMARTVPVPVVNVQIEGAARLIQ